MNKPPIENLNELKEKLEKDLRDDNKENKNLGPNHSNHCLLGCMFPILVIFLLFVGLCIYVYCQPYTQPILTCLSNQTEIYEACQRYRDLNNKYPENLKELEKEYLKDKNSLYCPLDTKKEGYLYANPDKEKGARYITSCHKHKLKDNIPFPPITITPEGAFRYDMESLNNK